MGWATMFFAAKFFNWSRDFSIRDSIAHRCPRSYYERRREKCDGKAKQLFASIASSAPPPRARVWEMIIGSMFLLIELRSEGSSRMEDFTSAVWTTAIWFLSYAPDSMADVRCLPLTSHFRLFITPSLDTLVIF